jgi:CDP-glucose 4,6-dehydratase
LRRVFDEVRPEVVFHLAAQPLVRPVLRRTGRDLVHQRHGHRQRARSLSADRRSACGRRGDHRQGATRTATWPRGYREIDQLGGHDAYSASKAGQPNSSPRATAKRSSSFRPRLPRRHRACRQRDRRRRLVGGSLVPTSSALSRRIDRSRSALLRPRARGNTCSTASAATCCSDNDCWRATPLARLPGTPVRMPTANAAWSRCYEHFRRESAGLPLACRAPRSSLHEAGLLQLDCAKARTILDWRPVWGIDASIANTARWYARWLDQGRAGVSMTCAASWARLHARDCPGHADDRPRHTDRRLASRAHRNAARLPARRLYPTLCERELAPFSGERRIVQINHSRTTRCRAPVRGAAVFQRAPSGRDEVRALALPDGCPDVAVDLRADSPRPSCAGTRRNCRRRPGWHRW